MDQQADIPASTPQSFELAKNVETLTKALALLAATVYGCGFLVISIIQADHGYSEANFFHAKAVAAGVWLLLSVAVPVFIFEQLYRLKRWISEEIENAATTIPATVVDQRDLANRLGDVHDLANNIRQHGKEKFRNYLTFGPRLFLFAAGCQTLGSFVFDQFVYHPLRHETVSSGWTKAVEIALVVNLALLAVGGWRKLPRFLPTLAALTYTGLLVAEGFDSDPLQGSLSRNNVVLWFLGIGLLAALRRRFVPTPLRMETTYLYLYLSVFGLILLTFTDSFYPYLDPGWGGGAPVPVVIYFKGDTAKLWGKSVAGYMLEETDQGYYVADDAAPLSQASFVSRSEVSLVDFYGISPSDIARGESQNLEFLRIHLLELPTFPEATHEPKTTQELKPLEGGKASGAATSEEPEGESRATPGGAKASQKR